MKTGGKLGAMVLYIVSRCGGRRNFSRVMLCRLCYFSDFGSYELRGTPVSGTPYVMANGGPEPAGIDDLLADMSRRRALGIRYHHGSAEFSVPSAPDLSALSADDVACIDAVIERYGGMNERILSWKSREDSHCIGRMPSETVDYASVGCSGRQEQGEA